MVAETAHVLIVESETDAARALSDSRPSGDVNLVLCCGPEEPLVDFAARVFRRIRSVRVHAKVVRLSYVLGASRSQQCTARRLLLKGLTTLLGRGAWLRLVAAQEDSIDLLELLDSLMPVAQAGVEIQAHRLQEPASPNRSGMYKAVPRPPIERTADAGAEA